MKEKELKKARSVVRFILTKDLLKNKKEIKNNEYLKEKIENYFKYIRLSIIETASTYKDTEEADFTSNIIDGIFSEKEVFYQQKEHIISYKDLLDAFGDNYKEDFFIRPIKEFKKAAELIDDLYQEGFNTMGINGIKEINKNVPNLLINDTFNTKELVKVSKDAYEVASIIDNMIANKYGINYEEEKDNLCIELYTKYKQKTDDEERKRIYS